MGQRCGLVRTPTPGCMCICVPSWPTLCYPTDCSCQAPLPMEFSRQEYWSGLPFPTPGNLPDPGIEPTSLASPALASGFFTCAPPGKASPLDWGTTKRRNITNAEVLLKEGEVRGPRSWLGDEPLEHLPLKTSRACVQESQRAVGNRFSTLKGLM